MAGPLSRRLPQFPWDRLAPIVETAQQHPDGAINLSVGVPVDSTPAAIQQALQAASDAFAYPTTIGVPQLRRAIVDWFDRVRLVPGLAESAVLPTTGSKEVVAWLPTLLGIGAGSCVALPAVAYPTYEVGARIAGADVVLYDGHQVDHDAVDLVWVNSPSNPTGAVLDVAQMRSLVCWARDVGAIVVSDECYATVPWGDCEAVSLLDPRVCDGDHTGLLVVHSLSKQSSMAGYRAGLLAGDPELMGAVTLARKHSGMMVPLPIQHAMVAALTDDQHINDQAERYRQRLDVLRPAVKAAGFDVFPGQAGLYIWGTLGEDCWLTADRLATSGIVVAPGEFYGQAAQQHVRISLTGTDQNIQRAAERLHSRPLI